jgi:hypothetical protein
MERDAYAISQNLAEIIAPSSYNADALDETRLLVSEETLTPYLAFIEQLTNCSVYLVNTRHDVTGYFSGVIQTIKNQLLPAYLEQSIALGFMGKTPFIQAQMEGETHLTTSMPVMNTKSQVLGVVLLTSTLREQGFIDQARYGKVILTSEGRRYAEDVWRTHRTIRQFLHAELGVPFERADEEACTMEHALSKDTMARWLAHLEANGISID